MEFLFVSSAQAFIEALGFIYRRCSFETWLIDFVRKSKNLELYVVWSCTLMILYCRWEANKTAIFDPATWFYLYVLCYERVVKPYLLLILQFFLSQQPAS